MFKARYYKSDGSKGPARDLPATLFDGVVNEGVLHQAVKAHLANQRQGTHSAKNRSAVSGGSRKPWRQKGTGRARQGSIRAVQWAGGGRAFPPTPHSWRQKLPRKVRELARRSAFNSRAEEERVVLVDGFAMEAPKTAALRDYLAAIELAGRKALVLTDGQKPEVYLSSRNLQHVLVRPFGEESVYDVLWADVVVIEREAMDRLGADAPAGASAAQVESSGGDQDPAPVEADADDGAPAEAEGGAGDEEADDDA
jgi:large subunit ribosomal protein L4